jgi:hypothetical protein
MAFTHIHFDQQTQYGSKQRRALTNTEDGRDGLFDIREAMAQMRDGDGSAAIHYAEVTERFGYPTDAKSKEAFDEINAACIALDGIAATLNQLFAKMRG